MAAAPTTTLVVTGVSGSGKSTVAGLVAARTGWVLGEGDDHHPSANVEKMRSGRPLDDLDREPWLRDLAAWIGGQEAARRDAVLACSALARTHRHVLGDGHPSVVIAHLVVPEGVLRARVAQRRGHLMPASLLASQLAAMEPLAPDEPGFEVRADGTPAAVAQAVLEELTRRG